MITEAKFKIKDHSRIALGFQLSSLNADYHNSGVGGCYQLFLKVREKLDLGVGALGNISFPPGIYIYTGSQQKNLMTRLIRHVAFHKKRFWHIDYLTSDPGVTFLGIISYFGGRQECGINKNYRVHSGAQIRFPGFGSTDCKKGCGSHLLFLKSESSLNLRRWGNLYPESQSDWLSIFL
ncbi:MAG: GIY-YIG nuclease family protein [Bacteroidales bacterium]|nr:GIY-YIG nuclease family protein [Bacteroidales bacterium]